MDVKTKIQSLLKEASLYHSQGLLQEAKDTYIQVGQLIKKAEIKNKSLLPSVVKKIRLLQENIKRFEDASIYREMPENVQQVIKTKFAFAKDEESAELKGAIALAKFGQYEAALKEFKELMTREDDPLIRADAAINIIRCYRITDAIDNAIDQYREWISENLFEPEQLEKIRSFLQDILDKKGINHTLPKAEVSQELNKLLEDEISEEAMEDSESEFAETQIFDLGDMSEFGISDNQITELAMAEAEVSAPQIAGLEMTEIPDISSVEITLDKGPKKGEAVELDVSFQSGNTINLLLSKDDKELVENLNQGVILNNVRFYSPMAMFNGSGKITSKTLIESGPKQGDYSLDIEISLR